MHGTLMGYFHQFPRLVGRERTPELNRRIDPIEQGVVPDYTIEAVFGVHARVRQADDDTFERPLSRARIQPDGHRHAGAECGHEEIVRTGPAVRATGGDRLICDEVMTAGGDLLDKSLRTTPNDNDAFCFCHGEAPWGT